jgi:hypothetical protein
MSDTPEEFLDKNVRGLVEAMISSTLQDKPKEPVKISSHIDSLHDRMASKLFRLQISRH